MGHARICDKCRRVLECTPDAKIKIYVHHFGDINYELCTRCTAELRTWLDSENPFSKLKGEAT